MNQKRAKDPFGFVIPNFLVQVSSPDGHMKNVKWQGHVGEKKSVSLEHFQAIMIENQMNDFDDEEEDDAIDQADELTKMRRNGLKKWESKEVIVFWFKRETLFLFFLIILKRRSSRVRLQIFSPHLFYYFNI